MFPTLFISSFTAMLILAVPLLIWFYFLYEIVTSDFDGNEGTLWALLVFFVPFIGLLAYLAYGRKSRKAEKTNSPQK